ncbi:WYL domain-containing protein [Oscillibacter valericigenes]|uniref:helix-turn-helix transcriptional regulator n=1 Tax=Oscillibacter valericigenes TaxID=351091 RepID=UPI001F4917EE|nr:WYL domain-containing protein [Oscillibacter valericigenes]MCF2664396.1 WYL domain-containing protein [Oscillibacter valericigenes]
MEIEKSARLLYLYQDFIKGVGIQKKAAADRFGVNERSLQRDIEDLRCFFANQTPPGEIVYDARQKVYRLIERDNAHLSNSEVLAVCKILLESRSMHRDEMLPILDKLVNCCVPAEQRRAVVDLLANEKHLYIEPHHGKRLLDGLWELGEAIQKHLVTEITYEKLKGGETVQRTIEPVGLMFSEYYFYLVAFIRDIDRAAEFENPDDLFPTIYRVDRIKEFHITGEHFQVPYQERFQEGEFRKRVQFMYGGKLQKIRFKYTGPSIEAVLDRLPTAKIVEQTEDGWIVKAEVFGKGIDMWIRSQGKYITMMEETYNEWF